jgi:hypothetical protein
MGEMHPGDLQPSDEFSAAEVRLGVLLEEIAADVGSDDWSPAPADVDELRDGLEAVWTRWRAALGRTETH